MKPKLFFFTAEYPYGNVSETFIENEIQFLAEAFSEVIIIPTSKSNDKMRPLPLNVKVSNIFVENEKYNRIRIFIKYFRKIIFCFFSEFLTQGNFLNYIKNWKYYLDFILIQANKYQYLNNFLKHKVETNDVFYDFWYANSSLALSFLRKDGLKNKIIIRTHRYDLYDDQWPTNKVPFRNYIFKNSSKIIFSNSHGYTYFISKMKNCDLKKLDIKYLAVHDKNTKSNSQKIKHNDFTIVSCSGVSSRKRVGIIVDVLLKLNQNITWFHFGDGILMNELKEKCTKLPANIKYVLKGHVDNKDVLDFYQNNKIDLFMSFTLSEGLPVSFKEIISFGIPILSTDVCGIPDIVNETTGVLVKTDENIESIVEKVNRIIENYTFDETKIKTFFKNNFLAEKVYPDFINNILLKN